MKHGTVTARINNKCQYEITTLRIDSKTDGRHAKVEFINDWKLDASRRDLTINSMFIDFDGVLYDYFDGRSDLENKRIRFVGDPSNRIVEDYLRIFRYFRFHTRFGSPGIHDHAILSVMKKKLDGLKTISAERIWSEMKRILSNVNCSDSVKVMFSDLSMGPYLGFQNETIDLAEFKRVQKCLAKLPCSTIKFNPETVLASLVANKEELISIAKRLKPSNLELNTINYILANRMEPIDFERDEHRLRTRLALLPEHEQTEMRQYIVQLLIYQGIEPDSINRLRKWTIPKFPFKGNRIVGPIKPKHLKNIITELKEIWAGNYFAMSEEEFQREMSRLVVYYSEQKK